MNKGQDEVPHPVLPASGQSRDFLLEEHVFIARVRLKGAVFELDVPTTYPFVDNRRQVRHDEAFDRGALEVGIYPNGYRRIGRSKRRAVLRYARQELGDFLIDLLLAYAVAGTEPHGSDHGENRSDAEDRYERNQTP